ATEPSATDALLLERGARVYSAHCAACHGRRGDGRGSASAEVDPAPRDFTLGVYKWRSTPSGALPTERDLVRTVRVGAPGTSMPAFAGRLSDEEIRAVVARVRAFSTRFREEEIPSPVALPRRTPSLDDAARRRGRGMYLLMQCWTCHGARGRGDGPAAATLRDDRGQPIAAYDFTRGFFRSGGRPLDVYRTFTTGVNGTPMPAYEEALSVGRDAFADLRTLRPVLDASGMRHLRTWVASMPTTETIANLPERASAERSARLRWDLVAYVMALSEGNRAWRWLTTPLYPNP
ncbi:MAG: c-type cytochrome, partial [Deltaproteobacteria bacterium]|nr:c-type cytochrome [Deltaproteobacteria bacterium]